MLNKFFRFAFARSGDKTAVPDAIVPGGDVSYDQGYGPDYQLPPDNAQSKDIERDKNNQLFFDITTALQEYQTNGVPDWIDPAQNGAVNFSYPAGARVRYTDGVVYVSLVAANNSLPTDLTKWVPMGEGITPIAGLTNANVVLTAVEASRAIITLAGALTGALAIILPTSRRSWVVRNGTTNAFAVTVRTAAGTGVVIPSGESRVVWGDGTNILAATGTRNLLGLVQIGATGNYIPSPGATFADVLAIGGGGGGGGTNATGAGQGSAGSGGGAGGFARRMVNLVGVASVPCTIGAAGTSAPNSGGIAGGTTSFGGAQPCSATGGTGGSLVPAQSNAASVVSGGAGGGAGSGGDINGQGGFGGYAVIGPNTVGGGGGGSIMGSGAPPSTSAGNSAASFGAGGGGGAAGPSTAAQTGGSGVQGRIYIWEYN